MNFLYEYQGIELHCTFYEDSIERFDRATGREYEEFFTVLESAEHKGQDILPLLNAETIEDIEKAFKDQQDQI